MTKAIKAIVFDLDGTLINTVPDVIHALNYTLTTFHLKPIKLDDIFGLIGNGAKHLVGNAFQRDNNVRLSAQELEAALQCYLQYYAENPIRDTKIYPDVVSTLDQFQQQGIEMAICTNKSGSITRLVLEKLNLHTYFHSVYCGDEVSHPKPHAKHLLDVVEHMKIPSEQVIYIGDSEVDKMTASNADIKFIGVTYGYELKQESAPYMINHFNELPALIEKIFAQEKVL